MSQIEDSVLYYHSTHQLEVHVDAFESMGSATKGRERGRADEGGYGWANEVTTESFETRLSVVRRMISWGSEAGVYILAGREGLGDCGVGAGVIATARFLAGLCEQ
jgi:hypothetical protein